MSLRPIEHPHKLTSPAEAAALYRGLRQRRVGIRGFHTSDPQRLEALLAAAEPKRDNTISFVGGALDDDARKALHELCDFKFDYLDVASPTAELRVWPGRYAWVDKLPDKPAADFLQTESIAAALERFEGLCGEALVQGHISRFSAKARAALLRFLRATRTEIHVSFYVKLQVARTLTELFPDQKLDWQGGAVQVDFPAGRIHGSLKTPKVDERHRQRWLARVDKALRRAQRG